MGKRAAKTQGAWLRPRLRVMIGDEIALGPGRVDLLDLIDQTGSLKAAAERMGVSYMRAWNLVKSTNRSAREPLVEVARGGKTGGGARLTIAGRKAYRIYREMEKQVHRATRSNWGEMRKLLAS